MVEIQNLSAGYKGKNVLHHVSLDFPDGLLTVVTGRNGSGKSTLAKAAAGLLPAASGCVLADGRLLSKMKDIERARHILYLDSSIPSVSMPVKTLIEHGRYARSPWPRKLTKEDNQAVEDALVKMHLKDLEMRPLDSLSAGQKQRAWLALALAQDAQAIIFDEPSSWLDPAGRFEFMETAKELTRQGKSVVVILHDLQMALQYADRMVLIDEGKLISVQSPEDFALDPKTKDVFQIEIQRLENPRNHDPKYIYSITPFKF